MTSVGDGIILWLGAYALHSTIFLAAVWFFERLWKRATPALLSTLWRTALVAGIATATLQASGLVNPVAGRLAIIPAKEIAAPSAAATRPELVQAPSLPAADASPQPESATPATAPSEPVVAARSVFTPDWPLISSILLSLWAGVVSLLALRAALMWLAAHRELRDRQPIVQGPLFERIQALAQDIGLRRLPQVSFSERIAGPFTLPSGEICIPVWARERLPQHQLDAMLAHEMAHVLNRDSFWLTIGMAVGTVFFFQPLNLIARSRLANLAELAADDWAATRAGSGRPLAECISTFVDIALTRAKTIATPEFAAAMAKPKSELVQRVERLLSGRYTDGALPMRSKLLIGACAIGLGVLVPGFTAPANGEPSPQRSVSIRNSNGNVSLSLSTSKDDYTLNAEGRGQMKLAPDGSGMEQLSNGGYLDVTYGRNGQSRRVRFTGEGGAIKRQFWVGKEIRAWNAEADRFVQELMPILFRETGLNANERVAWLLQQRGEDALLSEIGLIDSDSIQRIYAGIYADKVRLSDQRLEQLLAIVGRQIESDSELRLTLTGIYETQKPAGRQLAGLLRTASTIDSDSETRLVLTSVAKTALDTDEAMAAYLDAAALIGSDSEMRLALSDIVSSASINDTRIQQAIALAGDRIASDSELRLVLSRSARRVAASDALAAAYLKASGAIDSSSERRLTLMALADDAKLSAGSWRMLLDTAASIDSSSEKRLVLTGVASRMPRQADVVSAYRAAMETIDSQSERRLAELALN